MNSLTVHDLLAARSFVIEPMADTQNTKSKTLGTEEDHNYERWMFLPSYLHVTSSRFHKKYPVHVRHDSLYPL